MSLLVSPSRVRFMSTSLPPRSPNGTLTYSRCTAYSPSWDHSFFANTAYSTAATHTHTLAAFIDCIIIALLHCQQLLLSTIEHKPPSTFIYFQSNLTLYYIYGFKRLFFSPVVASRPPILLAYSTNGIRLLSSHYRTIHLLFLDYYTCFEMIDRMKTREKE